MVEYKKTVSVVEDKYELSDMNTDSDPLYFGYVTKEGKWYIKRLSESSGTVRFIKGNDEYTTNWNNKGNLSYSTYDETF